MTSRERPVKILRGEPLDRVPFLPNIGQWFDCHKAQGTLPPERMDRKYGNEVKTFHPPLRTSPPLSTLTFAAASQHAMCFKETGGGEKPLPT